MRSMASLIQSACCSRLEALPMASPPSMTCSTISCEIPAFPRLSASLAMRPYSYTFIMAQPPHGMLVRGMIAQMPKIGRHCTR